MRRPRGLEKTKGDAERKEDERNATVREAGEQQRVGQRAVAQAAARACLAVFLPVAVGLVERRANRQAF